MPKGELWVRVLFGSEREDRAFELPFLALSGAAASLTALGAAPAALAQSQDAQAGETHTAGAQSASAQATDADADSVSDVVVTGVRPLMGDKIPLTLQDAPQSVNVLPQKLLEAQ